MPAVARLSLDFLFAIVCAVVSPAHDGTIHTVMITDRGPIDAGTIEISGGTLTFFDGIGERKSKLISLVALDADRSRYRYEHKIDPPQEIVLDEVVLNRADLDPTATKPFRFRLADGSTVQFQQLHDVIYLHLDGTPNTIVLQK